ncbi:MAG: hypothetical protein AAFS10_16250, partial [Myxococcota bacterium]
MYAIPNRALLALGQGCVLTLSTIAFVGCQTAPLYPAADGGFGTSTSDGGAADTENNNGTNADVGSSTTGDTAETNNMTTGDAGMSGTGTTTTGDTDMTTGTTTGSTTGGTTTPPDEDTGPDMPPFMCDGEGASSRENPMILREGEPLEASTCEGDEDWFAISAEHGCRVDVELSGSPSLSMGLWRANGDLAIEPMERTNLRFTIPQYNGETVLLRLAAGVAQANADYTVSLQVTCLAELACPGDDLFEDNNDNTNNDNNYTYHYNYNNYNNYSSSGSSSSNNDTSKNKNKNSSNSGSSSTTTTTTTTTSTSSSNSFGRVKPSMMARAKKL